MSEWGVQRMQQGAEQVTMTIEEWDARLKAAAEQTVYEVPCGGKLGSDQWPVPTLDAARPMVASVHDPLSNSATTNPKDRLGLDKPQVHLVPPAATLYEAKVFELGAAKYGAYNWRTNKVRMTVYLSAALRHIYACLDGQSLDPESGQPHAAHARACMGIILDAYATGNLIDDRPAAGAAAQLIAAMTETKA